MTLEHIPNYFRLFLSLLAVLLSAFAPLRQEQFVPSRKRLIWACYALFALAWINAMLLWTLSIAQQNHDSLPALHAVFFAGAATIQVDRLCEDSQRFWRPYVWSWGLGSVSEAIGLAHTIAQQDIDIRAWLDFACATAKLLIYVIMQYCACDNHRYKPLPQDDTERVLSESDDTDIETGPRTETERSQWRDQLKTFRRFIWPRDNKTMTWRLFAILVLNLVIEAVGLLIPQAYGRVIDVLPTEVAFAGTLIIWIALALCKPVLNGLKFWIWVKLRSFRRTLLDTSIYTNIMSADHSFHAGTSATELITSVDNAQGVESSFDDLMENTADGLFMICVTVPVTAAKFDLSILSLVVVCLVAAGVIFRRATDELFRANTEFLSINESHKKRREDTIRGWKTAAAYMQVGYYINKNNDRVRELNRTRQAYTMISFYKWIIDKAVNNIGCFAGAILICWQVRHGQTTSGYVAEAAEARKILDMEPRAKKGKELRLTNGEVEIRNVMLNCGEKVVLENFSLSISGGSKVALVGPSGVGKSTIVGLLSGQLKPKSGEILVDGQDINKVDYDSYIPLAAENQPSFSSTLLPDYRPFMSETSRIMTQIRLWNDVPAPFSGGNAWYQPLLTPLNSPCPKIAHYVVFFSFCGDTLVYDGLKEQTCVALRRKGLFTEILHRVLKPHLPDYMGYDMKWSQPFCVTSPQWAVVVYHIGCFESAPNNPMKNQWSALQMIDDWRRIRAIISATPYGHVRPVPSL
ncbi:ABC transporter [Colletotrichum camelliae]|nr:ABC transporter [Colletotrichum camelliae]